MITTTLRDLLNAEIDERGSLNAIANEIPCITQPGLRKFVRGDSNGAGTLIDALADRYGVRLTQPRRKKAAS